jgi:hypothetical protein
MSRLASTNPLTSLAGVLALAQSPAMTLTGVGAPSSSNTSAGLSSLLASLSTVGALVNPSAATGGVLPNAADFLSALTTLGTLASTGTAREGSPPGAAGGSVMSLLSAIQTIGSAVTGGTTAPTPLGGTPSVLSAMGTLGSLFSGDNGAAVPSPVGEGGTTLATLLGSGQKLMAATGALMPQEGEGISPASLPALLTFMGAAGTFMQQLNVVNPLS